ncbi:helix-turn-helix transcriptional regulator [Roseibacterium sp. KMU-115]|uniref:Helix-turn-helix transcriptional regulator n=1 Tax=Roseicyclus persicicus TaxID=2650661 RepID=A0A7X6GXF7_9RHOB|nr:helix-turn-helix transcriptional regulator [Roseibacterium persicicum]
MSARDSLNNFEVGARLRVLREMLQLGKMEMADEHGIDRTNYGRMEAGTRRLPIEIGYRLAERCHVTLDWLYRGRWDHLTLEMAERLRKVGNG